MDGSQLTLSLLYEPLYSKLLAISVAKITKSVNSADKVRFIHPVSKASYAHKYALFYCIYMRGICGGLCNGEKTWKASNVDWEIFLGMRKGA